jgi:hypothetical protein
MYIRLSLDPARPAKSASACFPPKIVSAMGMQSECPAEIYGGARPM